MASSDDSSANGSSKKGCGTIIVCTTVGFILGPVGLGPVGAPIGFFIGLLLASGSTESSETLSEGDPDELEDPDEFPEGGLPYEIDTTWAGIFSEESRLKVHQTRLSLESKTTDTSEDIPFSSISTIEKSRSLVKIDLIPKDRTTISFPDEKTAGVVKEVILQVMDGERPHEKR